MDLQDNSGKSALMVAWSTDVAQLLLEKGAQVDLQDYHGKSALMVAVEQGSNEVVQLLLERGARVELQDRDGRIALIYASQIGHLDITMLLLKGKGPEWGLVNAHYLESAVVTARGRNHFHIEEFIKVCLLHLNKMYNTLLIFVI